MLKTSVPTQLNQKFLYDVAMEYQWDSSKAARNLSEHGISFDEAKTVFSNPLALIFDDEAP
ncbi:MAG: BrnT family toxin [Leptolyngbyaceae cyanobacterium]